jgi:predicted phage terminase large subunit-like protein
MALTPQQAAQRLLIISKAKDNFHGFVKALYPQFELADFQMELIKVLDALEKGELGTNRLLITMPPRHGKSWLASTLFPVYYLARKPNRNVLATSYNQDLAKTFGRQTRDHAKEPIVHQAFPDFLMSEESKAVDDWRTTFGGSYYATGMGGSTTGRAATLLLVDDPVKAREEADSATQRNKTWSYYVSALTTRKQPEPDGTKPIEIVILTRWHPDDLAGRIIETEDWKEGAWHHINFPAVRKVEGKIKRSVASLPEDDPRHIPSGELSSVAPSKRHYTEEVEEALWPTRFPLEELKKRERLDPREFSSLYQQSPYIQGGNLIKSSWWCNADQPECNTVIISCDTAFKKTETADYSVMMVLGMDDNSDIHILDIVRERYDFPELKRAAITLNAKWRGKGLRGMYVEDKASGQSLIQELRNQSGMAVIPVKVGTDKVSRLNAVLPLVEGGRVFLPNDAQWLDSFMDEAQSFPNGKHDDMIDALSMGLEAMSKMGGQASEMLNTPINMGSSLNTQFSQSDKAWWEKDIKSEPNFTGWGEL